MTHLHVYINISLLKILYSKLKAVCQESNMHINPVMEADVRVRIRVTLVYFKFPIKSYSIIQCTIMWSNIFFFFFFCRFTFSQPYLIFFTLKHFFAHLVQMKSSVIKGESWKGQIVLAVLHSIFFFFSYCKMVIIKDSHVSVV